MERDDRLFAVIAVCVVLGVAVVTAVLWYGATLAGDRPSPATVQVQPITDPTPASPASPSVAVIDAGLIPGDGDELVRALAVRLSGHPALASFLVPDHLLRRLVAAVDAVAGGYSPSDELAFMRPRRPFLVREDAVHGLVIAAGSFRRYDLATDVFLSLDTGAVVAVFERLRDRLEEAHREISWGDASFADDLHEAMDNLLAVPVPDGQLAVERRTLTYAFADERLETLSAAQRQLLRMGPDNAHRVQAKLRELEAAFGWSPPAAPSPDSVVADLTPLAGPASALSAASPDEPSTDNQGAAASLSAIVP